MVIHKCICNQSCDYLLLELGGNFYEFRDISLPTDRVLEVLSRLPLVPIALNVVEIDGVKFVEVEKG